jgi:hypothetical protein
MFAGFTPFTWFHVILSLAMLVAGIPVLRALLRSERAEGWTTAFLVTAIGTSATGFGFLPVTRLLDSHYVGIVSLVVLGLALLARYVFQHAGSWRWVYAVSIVLAFYLDVFVLIAQTFKKVPALHAAAPTLAELPFVITQGGVFLIFACLTVMAVRRFHPAMAPAPA